MSNGEMICGKCYCNTAPACGCWDFTTGSWVNAMSVVEPLLLARSIRRWEHEKSGGGRTFSPSGLTKHNIAENMRRLRQQGSSVEGTDY